MLGVADGLAHGVALVVPDEAVHKGPVERRVDVGLRLERRREAPYNSDWILTLMREHNTHFAMIYDSWFPYWPATFHPVAELNMPGMLLGPSSRRVSLYADSEPAAAQLLQAVRAYQTDHPDKADWFWIHRSQP